MKLETAATGKMPDTVMLHCHHVEGFEKADVGDTVRLVIRGKLTSKGMHTNKTEDGKPDSRQNLDLEIASAAIDRGVSDRDVEKMDEDDMDDEMERQFNERASKKGD